jgi:hypothetical protein
MRRDAVERPPVALWIAIVGGLGLSALVGLSDSAYALWCSHVTSALPQRLIRDIFLGAVVVHAGEAAYAWRLARGAGLKTAAAWTLQTFLIGFPSLGRLRKLIAAQQPMPTLPRAG